MREGLGLGEASDSGVPITGLTDCTCRWPLWPVVRRRIEFREIRYCGRPPKIGRAYCEQHDAVAHGRAALDEVDFRVGDEVLHDEE